MAEEPTKDGRSRPVPDPTSLTTEALDKGLANLQELAFERMSLNDAVCTEKFNSVAEKLNLIERQRVEQKSDTEKAVQAALNAAKEAVKEQTTASEARTDKSEAATTKSIDQLAETFNTAMEGLRREIGDVKEKTTAIEQRKVGGQEARAVAVETRAGLSSTAQLGIAAFVALLLLIGTVASILIAASSS